MARKVDIVNNALSRLGISGITREPTPEDMAEALNQLEFFMGSILNRSIDLNYAFEAVPDPQADINVNDRFRDWISSELAKRLIPYYGSSVSSNRIAQIQADCRSLYAGVSAYRAAQVTHEVRYPSRQPRGHGNTQRYDPYDRFYPDAGEPNRDVLSNPVAITPDPDDPSQPATVTGAQNGAVVFNASPRPASFRSSMAISENNLIIHNANTIYVYTMAGVLVSTNNITGLSGNVVSVAAKPSGGFVIFEDVSTFQSPQYRFREMSSAFAAGITIGPNVTTGGSPNNCIAVTENGDLWLVSPVTDDLRLFNSAGVLQQTIDASSIGDNASHLIPAGNDIWVGDENSEVFHRYSGGFTGSTFSARTSAAFGIAFNNNIFWEGSAETGDVYRRPAILT